MSQLETTGTTNSWKMKVLVVGTVVGAVIGLGTAYLLARTAEESHDGPPQIKTGDALKAGINIIGVMRGVAALAGR